METCKTDPLYTITRQALNNSLWDNVFMDHTKLPRSNRETTFLANQSPRDPVNQENSGTCWIHATLSYYRDCMIRSYPKIDDEKIRFSVAFILFHHLYELCDSFLQKMERMSKIMKDNDPRLCWSMDNIISDGARGNIGYILIKRYGIVPYDIMGSNTQVLNTERLIQFLKKILVRASARIRSGEKNVRRNIMPIVHKYLCVSVGTPPKEFDYEFRGVKPLKIKKCTPLAFYNEYLKKEDPGMIYMSTYTPIKSCNWYVYKDTETVTKCDEKELAIHSVSPEDLMSYVIKTIQKKSVVYVGVDITNDFSEEYGWGDEGLFNTDIILTDKEKKSLGVNEDTIKRIRGKSPNHAVLIVGYRTKNSKKDGQIDHFLIENSWGSESGKEGYLRVSPEWFLENVMEAAVPKNMVNKKSRKPNNIKKMECYESVGNLLN
jgi:bleomycin hydrolase